MYWNNDLIKMLSEAVMNSLSYTTTQRNHPPPPVLDTTQQLIGSRVHNTGQLPVNLGSVLSQAANRMNSIPPQTRSDWQLRGQDTSEVM